MNLLLIAINAKYIHSSLAVYSLYQFLPPHLQKDVAVLEFTINQAEDLILSEIFAKKPTALAFSCYIWNIGLIESLIETFKKIMPHVPIIVGGPEASFDNDNLQALGVDYIVEGEGEQAFLQIVSQLQGAAIPGEIATPLPLADIPFVYHQRFADLANRIIYYETSRGCPNRCGFCLSSTTVGVRFLPLDRVFEDLQIFLAQQVKQVKFVDRTFNAKKSHAVAIWQYLIAHDNGITNFHFEIAGEGLDKETLALLATARPGLFQMEIGVQTTNPQILDNIHRRTDTEKLFQNVQTLLGHGNIHLHLDLIVGLPGEDLASFIASFNQIMAIRPHKLQVGFLKLLKGSHIRNHAPEYGIAYKQSAPYTVLQTHHITFAEINQIHQVEHMVETFYGSSSYEATTLFMMLNAPSPYAFFHNLASFWHAQGYHLVSHKKMAVYTILYEYGLTFLPSFTREIAELLKFDMLRQENIRTFPPWITSYYTPDNRYITRTQGLHHFDYHIPQWLQSPAVALPPCPTSLDFDYSQDIPNRIREAIKHENTD